jgi:HD-GYP domain-containing protein (c-di-GMP phosphodiesterase class II)
MQRHSQAGYEILKNVRFPWPVAQMVWEHHERLDGSGYPRGLAGNDVLLEARILAVADTVEAMTSHRPYRPALSLEVALAEIEAGQDRLYDPEVVQACLAAVGAGEWAPGSGGPLPAMLGGLDS